MQIVTRSVNEGLVIGENLQVTVLEVCDEYVRLGFTRLDTKPTYWEETVYLCEEPVLVESPVQ